MWKKFAVLMLGVCLWSGMAAGAEAAASPAASPAASNTVQTKALQPAPAVTKPAAAAAQPAPAVTQPAAQPNNATATTAANTAAAPKAAVEQNQTAQPAAQKAEAAPEAEAKPAAPAPEYKIVVNIPSHRLSLYKDNKLVGQYPVATGLPESPTMPGNYTVIDMEKDPVWVDPTDTTTTVAAGESNPLGQRWIGYGGNYGIHGTNNPNSIGTYASHGCIRMFEQDVETVYDAVTIGTPVEIFYNCIEVDAADDGEIYFAVYPDTYKRQSVDIADVQQRLREKGTENFASVGDISDAIIACDGQRYYTGTPYTIIARGKKLDDKAVLKDDIMYIPVVDVSVAMKVDVIWDSDKQLLTSVFGEATGYNRNDTIYCTSDDLYTLFHVRSGLSGSKYFRINK